MERTTRTVFNFFIKGPMIGSFITKKSVNLVAKFAFSIIKILNIPLIIIMKDKALKIME